MKNTAFILLLFIAALGIGCQRGFLRTKSKTFDLTPQERVELALRVKDKPVDLEKKNFAYVKTNKGEFAFLLYTDDAPRTVANFVRLAEQGFYDGLIWHRQVGGFIIQGGDPLGTGEGNAGYRIDLEESGKPHVDGAVGMARGSAPNSASCQFYICLDYSPELDDRYCVFGQVTEGMDVVRKLFAGNDSLGIPPDTIRQITIEREPPRLRNK